MLYWRHARCRGCPRSRRKSQQNLATCCVIPIQDAPEGVGPTFSVNPACLIGSAFVLRLFEPSSCRVADPQLFRSRKIPGRTFISR